MHEFHRVSTGWIRRFVWVAVCVRLHPVTARSAESDRIIWLLWLLWLHSQVVARRCYLRVSDVEGLAEAFGGPGLPRTGVPRLEAVEDNPWRMSEFVLIDEDGNLVRIGRPI